MQVIPPSPPPDGFKAHKCQKQLVSSQKSKSQKKKTQENIWGFDIKPPSSSPNKSFIDLAPFKGDDYENPEEVDILRFVPVPPQSLIDKKPPSPPHMVAPKPIQTKSVKKTSPKQTKKRSPGRIKDDPLLKNALIGMSQKRISQSNFLNSICISSGDCLAFGREKERIRLFFNNMSIKYMDGDAKKIGSDSLNGIVHLLKYTKDNYSTYAVLKSSQNLDSDSLLYEYIVGKYFINNYVSKYPCFMETYDLYKYNYPPNKKGMDDLITLINNKKVTQDFYKKNLTKTATSGLHGLKNEIKRICADTEGLLSVKYAVLVEYLKDPISVNDYFTYFAENVQHLGRQFVYEVINILIQVYIPLGNLMNSFTHNDLHLGNILLYKVPDNKYITMHYKVGKRIVTIKTQYISKMIDYGRCYFNPDHGVKFYKTTSEAGETFKVTSEGITKMLYEAIDELIKEKKHVIKAWWDKKTMWDKTERVNACNGFNFFGTKEEHITEKTYYTATAIGNVSRDMSCIWDVLEIFNWFKKEHSVQDAMFNQFIYYLNTQSDLNERNDSGGLPKKVCPKNIKMCNVKTVRDGVIDFYDMMNSYNYFTYDNALCMGVMNIYDDGHDMEFIKGC
jgi:hypothetical protein